MASKLRTVNGVMHPSIQVMRSSSVLTFPFPVQLGPTYEPNSFGGPVEDPKYMDPPVPYQLSGEGKRYNHRADSDDFSQVSGARGKAVASFLSCKKKRGEA